MNNKLLFLDLETTGVDPLRHGVYQIACHYATVIRHPTTHWAMDIEIQGSFNSYIRPFMEDEIDPDAISKGVVSVEDFASFPDPLDVHTQFTEWMSQYVDKYDKRDKFSLINYWGHFDASFLRQFFANCGDKYYGSWFWSAPIDIASIVHSHLIHGGDETFAWPSDFKLATVAAVFGVLPEGELHDARTDVTLLANLYKRLKKGSL